MSCEEVLEKLQESLLHCKNNKTFYIPKNEVNINACENIRRYQMSLIPTKTRLHIDNEVLAPPTQYAIVYDVRERLLSISAVK
jgi:hypothetical protein